MSAISTITRVLDTLSKGPLLRSMVCVPSRGATDEELVAEDGMLPRPLSTCHRGVLKMWNGIYLDMIRLFGAGHTHPRIKPLHRKQMNLHREFPGWIVFADSPAGFVYAEDASGIIHRYDTQAPSSTLNAAATVAANLDDFLSRYVFGIDADQFCGGDWKASLQRAGVMPQGRSDKAYR